MSCMLSADRVLAGVFLFLLPELASGRASGAPCSELQNVAQREAAGSAAARRQQGEHDRRDLRSRSALLPATCVCEP